jgi:WD40 repeat protein
MPDGRRAVSASWDNTLKLWDLASGEVFATLDGHAAEVNTVALAVDGRRMVSVSDDRFIKVWDLERWVHLATFSADTSLVSCAIVPDGMTVIAGDGWGVVHILCLEGTT